MAKPTTLQILPKIQALEDYLNNMEMIPATHTYRNAVILALLSKALTVSRSICALVDAGFPAEAFALSRTLIEIYFSVRYIGNKDTEARAKKYVDYHARVRQEWQNIIKKYYPDKPLAEIHLDDDILATAKEFKSKAHWTGQGGQAQMMALEEDSVELDDQGKPAKSEFDYDAIYFWTSHYVHATVAGIEAHAIEPGTVFRVRARNWIDTGRGDDAAFNVVATLQKIVIRACRAMNEEQPDVLKEMQDLISEVANEAAGDEQST